MNFKEGEDVTELIVFNMFDLLSKYYPLCFNIPYDDSTSYSKEKIIEKNNYIATDGEFVYTLLEKPRSYDFARLKASEPQIRISKFEGCSHYYGVMFMPNGDCYELQCKITKEYLSKAHEIRGDWHGYKEGGTTRRFLSKASLMSAFELFKSILH